ncbi:hypothetical protein GCM10027284_08990 [Cyclobacterium sediminis]
MRPEIALGLGMQASDVLNKVDRNSRQKRAINLSTMSISGVESSRLMMDLDDEEEEEQASGGIYDGAPEGSVAMIPIKGSMMKYGTLCEYGMVEIAEYIRAAATHKNIGAIVLDIDSGGGGVDAIAPIVDAVNLAKANGKPVVASVDMACSAAYWAASVCDYIVADNGISSEVGSIGVMCTFHDVQGYYEKEGIKVHHIYSSESENKNEAFHLALEGKYELIKETELDPLARSFQNAIKTNRSGKLDLSAKGVLNGKTYFAQDALNIGLIDKVGSKSTAIDIALAKSHAKQFI